MSFVYIYKTSLFQILSLYEIILIWVAMSALLVEERNFPISYSSFIIHKYLEDRALPGNF